MERERVADGQLGQRWGGYVGKIEGVGPDAPIATNERGGRQSDSPYRLDLLPMQAVLELGKVLKHGADKYGIDNWRQISSQEHLNHALVHVVAHLAGDRQEGTHGHLAHLLCRVAMALEMHIAEHGQSTRVAQQ